MESTDKIPEISFAQSGNDAPKEEVQSSKSMVVPLTPFAKEVNCKETKPSSENSGIDEIVSKFRGNSSSEDMEKKKKQEDEARRLREKLKGASKQNDKVEFATSKVQTPAPTAVKKQNADQKTCYRMSEHNSNSESSEEESRTRMTAHPRRKRENLLHLGPEVLLKRALKIQFGLKVRSN